MPSTVLGILNIVFDPVYPMIVAWPFVTVYLQSPNGSALVTSAIPKSRKRITKTCFIQAFKKLTKDMFKLRLNKQQVEVVFNLSLLWRDIFTSLRMLQIRIPLW